MFKELFDRLIGPNTQSAALQKDPRPKTGDPDHRRKFNEAQAGLVRDHTKLRFHYRGPNDGTDGDEYVNTGRTTNSPPLDREATNNFLDRIRPGGREH